MHSYSLSVDTKDVIRTYLQRYIDKPDWNRIADAFKTIYITVCNIHKKMKEEIIFRVSMTHNILGPAPIISTEMKEVVAYLVGAVPITY